MKKIVTSFIALAALVFPGIAAAQVTQGTPQFQYVDSWVAKLLEYGQQAVTFLIVIATLWFIWTVVSYIRVKEAKDAEEKKKAMLRGIIGLFVIIAIWGIIRIITSTLGVGTGSLNSSNIPCPPGMQYDTLLKRCN